jgi:transcriptional antiterminator NusG
MSKIADGFVTEEDAELEKGWYVIHTYSGFENKVKTNLEKRLHTMEMQDKIFRVLVPTEEILEYKDGKKKTSVKKVFPGYVLVEMIMTRDSWHVVRNTPGVNGFVGSSGTGSKPNPLKEEEAARILEQMGVDEVRARIALHYAVKDSVKVIDGPFKGMEGVIVQIDLQRKKINVLLNMFGRETSVEFHFLQVAKV